MKNITEAEKLKSGSELFKLRFLFKDTFFYGFLNAFSRAFQVLSLPLFTRILSKADYGAYDLILIFVAFSLPLSVLGIDSAVARFFFDYEDDLNRRLVVSTGLFLQSIFAFILCLSIYFFSDELLHLLSLSNDYQIIFISGIFIIFLQNILNFSQNIMKWTFQRTHFILLSLGYPLTNISLILLFNFSNGINLQQIFYLQILTLTLFSFLGIYFSRSYLGKKIDFSKIKPMLSYGMPLMFMTILILIFPLIERVIISNEYSLKDLAFFAVSFRISRSTAILFGALQTAIGPFSYTLMNDLNFSNTYNTVIRLVVLFLCLFSMFFSFFSEEIVILIAGSEYEFSKVYLPFFMHSALISCIATMFGLGLEFSKKTLVLFYISLFSVILYLMFINYFISSFGILGLLHLSIAISYTRLLVSGLLTNYYSKLNIDILKPSISILFSMLISTELLDLLNLNFIIFVEIVYKIVLLLIVGAIFIYMFLDRTDRELIKNLIGENKNVH